MTRSTWTRQHGTAMVNGFAMQLDELGLSRVHLRGLHYRLIDRPKPDGRPYTNTDADWAWLQMHAAKAARWLRYIGFDRIVDHRNDAPQIIEFTPPPQPWGCAYVNTDFQLPTNLKPHSLLSLDAAQPNHLMLVGEKSSLRGVLDNIAFRYSADLYLPTGEMSDTMAHTMAASSVDDNRPMKVFYISDCDPSGWQMPISLARKLQALKVIEFPDMEFAVYRVGLLPEQVRMHGLPSTPLKDTERRADKWLEAMGCEQTEIDAMLALRPELLWQIIIDAITPFYDSTLDTRVAAARRDWESRAQAVIDEQTDAAAIADAVGKLERKRIEIEEILDTVRRNKDNFNLPTIPEIPAAQIDQPKPLALCDSRWDFDVQTAILIESRDYRLDNE
jgi:hypothetical protein